MANARPPFSGLSDDELLIELRRSVVAERSATAHMIEVLAEVDARRLYLGEGCSSLFIYCTQVLHLSEHAAYGRIAAARLARRVPDVLEALRTGAATLTTIGLISPHLTAVNCTELLAAVGYKSKREVEHLIAALAPKRDVQVSVRKVPARTVPGRSGPSSDSVERTGLGCPVQAPPFALLPATGSMKDACSAGELCDATLGQAGRHDVGPGPAVWSDEPARQAVIAPLAPERYKIQFTASRELHDKLRRAQDLLRHTVLDGDVATVVDRALTLLVEALERRKLAAATRPRPAKSAGSNNRYIPAAVKRRVWERDGGQCTFVGTQGRCTERGRLEFHHLVPFAAGGETSAGNLALRCRAHNQFEAKQFFGPLLARETRARYGADATRDVRRNRFALVI
jgi:hypothetical protein